MARVESQPAVPSHHLRPSPRGVAAQAGPDRTASPFALLVDGATETATAPVQNPTQRGQPSPPAPTSPANASRAGDAPLPAKPASEADQSGPQTVPEPGPGQANAGALVVPSATTPPAAEGQGAVIQTASRDFVPATAVVSASDVVAAAIPTVAPSATQAVAIPTVVPSTAEAAAMPTVVPSTAQAAAIPTVLRSDAGPAATPTVVPGDAEPAPVDSAGVPTPGTPATSPQVPVAKVKGDNPDAAGDHDNDDDATDTPDAPDPAKVSTGETGAVTAVPIQPVANHPALAGAAVPTAITDTGGDSLPLPTADGAAPAASGSKPAAPAAPKGPSGQKVAAGSPGLQQPQVQDAGETAPAGGTPTAEETPPGDGSAPASFEQLAERAASAAKAQERDKVAHVVAGSIDRLASPKPDDFITAGKDIHAGSIVPNGAATADSSEAATLQQAVDRLVTPAAGATQTFTAAAPALALPIAGIAVEIAARAQSGGNRFEIRLDPPELGRIDVQLDVDRSGQVTSRLVADKPETLDALRRDAGDLERALQQAGLKTADNGLQFALRDQSFAGRNDGGGGGGSGTARLIVPDPDLASAPAETLPTGYARLLRAGGGVDIRV